MITTTGDYARLSRKVRVIQTVVDKIGNINQTGTNFLSNKKKCEWSMMINSHGTTVFMDFREATV
ncbi:hypothetical protein J26TS2_44670 [Shouchella clausii]|nr:hypothetical protein J26TS2_44670 [Shouchella clausii]